MGFEKGNKSTVLVHKSGQIQTTIPRAIAQALGLRKSDKIEWVWIEGNMVVRPLLR